MVNIKTLIPLDKTQTITMNNGGNTVHVCDKQSVWQSFIDESEIGFTFEISKRTDPVSNFYFEYCREKG